MPIHPHLLSILKDVCDTSYKEACNIRLMDPLETAIIDISLGKQNVYDIVMSEQLLNFVKIIYGEKSKTYERASEFNIVEKSPYKDKYGFGQKLIDSVNDYLKNNNTDDELLPLVEYMQILDFEKKINNIKL